MDAMLSAVRPSGLDDDDITVRLAQASIAPHLITMIVHRLCTETFRDPKTWLDDFAAQYIKSSYPEGVGPDVAGRNCYAAELLLQDTRLAMEDCRRPL
jgi:hypothetical protein